MARPAVSSNNVLTALDEQRPTSLYWTSSSPPSPSASATPAGTCKARSSPPPVPGQAAATVDWLANLALIEVFPVWQNAIRLGGVMVCFALCVAAIAFVF